MRFDADGSPAGGGRDHRHLRGKIRHPIHENPRVDCFGMCIENFGGMARARQQSLCVAILQRQMRFAAPEINTALE